MSRPVTILVVDDNPLARKVVRVTLEVEGYRVLEAADGGAALAQVAAEVPDLVLQDLVLPDMDGVELARRLRLGPGGADLPIVAFSGFQSSIERARVDAVRFDDFLVKPVEPSRLVEVIARFAPPLAAAEERVGAGRHVLVVDDDPVQLKLARLRLAQVGFRVTVAAGGEAALASALGDPPDVVVSDVLMPGMDGYDLCLALRRQPGRAGLPVVLVSAYFRAAEDEGLARSVGAHALVTRTPGLEEVISAAVDGLARAAVTPAAEPKEPESEHVRREHGARVLQQLERQAAISADLLRRAALQTAQLSILGGIAGALAGSSDVERVLDDVLAASLDASGIARGALVLAGRDGRLAVRRAVGFDDEDRRRIERFFARAEVVDALAGGSALVQSAGSAATETAAFFTALGTRGCVVVPIAGGGRPAGALLLDADSHELREPDILTFGRAIAACVGQALALSAHFDRLAILSETSRLLGDSLDHDRTLASLASFLATRLGDLCAIDLVDDAGALRRVVAWPADPAWQAAAAALDAAASPAGTPLATGKATRVSPIPAAASSFPAIAGRLVAPLVAEGRVLGLLCLDSVRRDEVRPGRAFDDADLVLAEEIGRRAAVAVVNGRLYRLARDANRSRDEFLATVSHELRTPAAAMLGWVDLLKRKPQLLERGLEVIERNARLSSKLVGDILDVSRAITGKLSLSLTEVDVPDAVRAALDVASPAADAKGVTITVALDPAVRTLRADPDRLQQILWNLLGNAIKFTPKGGRVRLEVDQHASAIRVRVSDSGQGIAAPFLPYVFDRFRQADSSTTRAFGGLGLGLAVVRHLVEGHGGTVAAESPGAGEGATFTVTFPVPVLRPDARHPLGAPLPPPPAAPSTASTQAAPATAPLPRVLVVDDEADARDHLAFVLAEFGLDVVAVATVQAAMSELERATPLAIVSDLGMPHEDGFALIARVRAISRVPVIALTAYAVPGLEQKTRDAGFQCFLQKPVEAANLVAAIAAHASWQPRATSSARAT